MITGAQAVVNGLLRESIGHVFGIPGTMNLPVLDVLRDTPAIRFVLTRHEQGAAFMAYGYARALHRPTVVTATEGPGVTNLATGIGAAFKGYVPVISISGAQEMHVREREASQDIDQVTMYKPITKWAYSIPNVHKVQESIRKAFRIALADPFGPVHLDASRDILLEEIEEDAWLPGSYRTFARPSCSADDLDVCAQLIGQSQRPIFLVGGGVLDDSATELMMELAEATGIPAATLQYHPDAFPTSHPLALGPLGRNGWSSANRAMPQADLVVAVGAHLDIFSTQFKHGIISKEARIIHHSQSPSDVGMVFPVTHGLTGSTSSFIRGLSDRLSSNRQRWTWTSVEELRAEWDSERQATVDLSAHPIVPPVVAHAMRAALPENGAMILDAGNAGKHMRTFMDTYQPDTFQYISDWGSVGAGLPIAMGVKVARPDRPVMATVGDMGMMCNIGELETAVRENIPVVCVVFNDRGLGNERAFQNELYGGRIFAVDYSDVDFAALARVMGAHGERVDRAEDVQPAVKRALDSGRPAVVDVAIDQAFHAPVVYRQS
jgi:acetolactate synthase I/II/III large subunit